MSDNPNLLVIGGGIAGLSAAQTAARDGFSATVCEAESELGGLAKSVRMSGYTFDYSGHLLHLAKDETRGLIDSLPHKVDWDRLNRRSAVLMRDMLIPYPFQMHLSHAPDDVREECIAGLPELGTELPEDPAEMGFGDWIDATLGSGIAKHFMVPYNEKLSGTKVDEMTCEWLGRFVPRPSIEQIIEGAETDRVLSDGYNARFIYPAEGGIDHLIRALESGLTDVRRSTTIATVDPESRQATTTSGDVIPYANGVVATASLPAMVKAVSVPPASADQAGELRARSVTCVNFGVTSVSSKFDGLQWLYLPEGKFTAYRVGFYSRFSPAMAPPGRHSIYVEISHEEGADVDALVQAGTRDLIEAGIIESEEVIEVAHPLPMPTAYVIHTHRTSAIRRNLMEELAEMGIEMAGRYGRWEYASMEDAVWQGMQASQAVLAGATG